MEARSRPAAQALGEKTDADCSSRNEGLVGANTLASQGEKPPPLQGYRSCPKLRAALDFRLEAAEIQAALSIERTPGCLRAWSGPECLPQELFANTRAHAR